MSPATNPLPEANKPDSSLEATSHLEPGEEKQNVELNDPSTAATSTVKVDTEKNEGLGKDGGPATGEVPAITYSTGFKLVFILLALVLSVFLFSLDQVS